MQQRPFLWPVVPLCEKQLRDVNPADILDDGWFRLCDVYRGGGGYDKFPEVAKKLWRKAYHKQFVVQLYGCPLACPYCYVTHDGIWGKSGAFPTPVLVQFFRQSGAQVFHLMGGAPALYLKHWPELLRALPASAIFHSDFVLCESDYKQADLEAIRVDNAVYAVNIKGVFDREWQANTGKPFNEKLFWCNLNSIACSGINYYITFTGLPESSIIRFWRRWNERIGGSHPFAFPINIINYEAIRE